MSTDSYQAQKSDWIRPPRAGQITVLATSTVTGTVDLRTIGNQQLASLPAGNNPLGSFVVDQPRKGLVGHYIRVTAVTTPCYVAFGPTAASVGSITTASTGANAANNSVPIAAGTYQDFLVADDPADQSMAAAGPETWLGYVSTGAGFVTIAQASP
jgi:hypothetical protein